MFMQGTSTLYPLYIIILNWNLPADTIVCIHSVIRGIRSLGDHAQIVVVDNGSTDDSVTQFHMTFGTQIRIIEVGQNLGFAGGMNVGMRYAIDQGAATVLLLNNDTEVAVEMITALLLAAEQKPNAGILGPVIYYYDLPDTIWQLGDQEQPWLPVPLRIAPDVPAIAKGEPFRVDYITGCCLLLRRGVLARVGLFDERYFMYFEEADLCRRIRDAGYEIWSVPAARMWHKVATSTQKDRPGQRYWRTWGKTRFFTHHRHGRLPWLIHFYLTGKLVLTTYHDLVAGNWQLIAPLWAGTVDGYQGSTKYRKKYFRTG